MNPLRRAVLVAGGAALGGLLRVVLTALLPVAADDPALVAPGVLVVNVSGSLFAGVLAGLAARAARGPGAARLEAAMIAGFCGGYTSYSAFIVTLHEGATEAATEGAAGGVPWMAGIAAATVVFCPLAAALGMRASGGSTGGYPPKPESGPEKEAA